MDPLSEMLKELRLVSGIFLQAEFSAPWCVNSAPDKEDLQRLAPEAEHVILFHLLTEGSCSVKLQGDSMSWRLNAGDVVILPRNEAHLIGSDLHLAPLRAGSLMKPPDTNGVMRISHGGGGARTRFICGFLSGDPRLCHLLLQSLPSIIIVPLGKPQEINWITETMRFASQESGSAGVGSGAILSRVAELIFVEALRRYTASLPDSQQGWLAGRPAQSPCRPSLILAACAPRLSMDHRRTFRTSRPVTHGPG